MWHGLEEVLLGERHRIVVLLLLVIVSLLGNLLIQIVLLLHILLFIRRLVIVFGDVVGGVGEGLVTVVVRGLPALGRGDLFLGEEQVFGDLLRDRVDQTA